MSMYPIASANPVGNVQVVFSNIPQNFDHLQVRMFCRSAHTQSTSPVLFTLNNLTTTNHAFGSLDGNGSSVGGQSYQNYQLIEVQRFPQDSIADTKIFGFGIVDILDYSSSTKNMTLQGIAGFDTSSSGEIHHCYGNLSTVGPLTQLNLYMYTGFVNQSRIDLYGIYGEER